MAAPAGMRVEFKQAKRSDEQNAKLWAMLSEIAAQCPWHGVKLTADDWKFVFIDALKRELRTVPNIDGNGFVNLGRSSSDLSKAEMSDLIELIHAFAAQYDVKFKGDNTNSNSSGAPQGQADTPAAEVSPHPAAAGNPSPELSANPPGPDNVEARDGTLGGGAVSQPTLPEGWAIAYAGALRRAQKPESLPKYATEFWKQYGGWPVHKDTDNGPTAAAVYNAFANNSGNKDAIDDILRELL
jgi:hypothetical protein